MYWSIAWVHLGLAAFAAAVSPPGGAVERGIRLSVINCREIVTARCALMRLLQEDIHPTSYGRSMLCGVGGGVSRPVGIFRLWTVIRLL